MNVLIRAATEADLPRLAELERACFSDPWTEAMLRAHLEPGRLLLAAEAEGAVRGYLCLMHVLDEGDISNVAVAPDFRRRGLGDALLEALEERSKALELAFLTLEVRESNAAARGLYQKHGFVPAGRRRAYYEAPREDAILMTKELKA